MIEIDPFLEAVPQPALAIRGDERIAGANASARTLLGAGIVGRHFITALRQPALLDAIEAVLRGGDGRQADYLTSDDRQDQTFRVSIRPVPIDGATGALVCFEDVTAMERAGQMRRDFVANVSHELRTPLTALIGFIDTLRGPARDDAAGRARFLDIMEHEAQRMNRLVGDLLSLSRVEADERVRPTERVDLGDLVRSSLHRLQPLAGEAGVTLAEGLPPRPSIIVGDQDQLGQVVTNLTENAIKYSGAGATVTVSISPAGYEPALRRDGVHLSVTDTGPGIEAYHIPRLTERFYRVDSHRSREQGGTGLGLAIVKHIISRHRGRLRIDSKPGDGTTFTVVLPLA